MGIQVKSLETCRECIKKSEFPPCGVNTFYKSGELKDILVGNFRDSRKQDYIVCPVDAVKPVGQEVEFINEKCISCGLCINKCPYENIELESLDEEKVYKFIKNNILQIASFLKSSLETNYEIFTEVKTEGNARNKRIDIVVNTSKTAYLLKLFSGKPTSGKYERDYERILESSLKENQSKNVELIYLYLDNTGIDISNQIEISNKEYLVHKVSLENLISIFEK